MKLISRLQEDAFYRVNGKPHSSIIIGGVAYNFDKHGHNFIVLDGITGNIHKHIPIHIPIRIRIHIHVTYTYSYYIYTFIYIYEFAERVISIHVKNIFNQF